jgi:hypothetical protein
MKPVLVFLAPSWTPDLEELILITKESFEVKVLTQKQNFDFGDAYVEILQCFESYTPTELARLLPWILQLRSPRLHLLLPSNPSARQLAGIGAVLSMIRPLADSILTHSEWPKGGIHFAIWLKAFGALFDGVIPFYGTRHLSLTENQNTQYLESDSRDLQVFSYLWSFPSAKAIDEQWAPLMKRLLSCPQNDLELWNWDRLPIREQNQIRAQFAQVWHRFRPHTCRNEIHAWDEVHFLVLIGNQSHHFSETDLLDLVLNLQISLIMDVENRNRLRGPWKDGDNFWLWTPQLSDNETRPWNDPNRHLPLDSLAELKQFRDQISNEILRSFIKLDFQRH